MRKLVYLYSFPPMLLVQVLFLYHQELAFPSVLIITFQTLSVIDGKQSAAFTVFGVYQVCRQSPYTLQMNLFCPRASLQLWLFSPPEPGLPALGEGLRCQGICTSWECLQSQTVNRWGTPALSPLGAGDTSQVCPLAPSVQVHVLVKWKQALWVSFTAWSGVPTLWCFLGSPPKALKPRQSRQTESCEADTGMGSGIRFLISQMAARTHRGDKRGDGNPGKVPQLRGCDQAGRGCMGGGTDLCNPSYIRGSGSNGNFKDCGVSLLFSFNNRKMQKEEYDSQPSAQSVCPWNHFGSLKPLW